MLAIAIFLVFMAGFTVGFLVMKSVSNLEVKWKEYHFKSFHIANSVICEDDPDKKLKLLEELNEHLSHIPK